MLKLYIQRGFYPVYIFFVLISAVENCYSADGNTVQLERQAQHIADTTMSPFCPGLTLSACPSPKAFELRGEIISWLAEGYTPEAVQNRLSIMYGDKIKSLPASTGIGLFGWLVPVFFLLTALLIVIFMLRRMRHGQQI